MARFVMVVSRPCKAIRDLAAKELKEGGRAGDRLSVSRVGTRERSDEGSSSSARRIALGHLPIEFLDSGASPRCSPEKREARLDARIELKAADGNGASQGFPSHAVDEIVQHSLQRHAVEWVVRVRVHGGRSDSRMNPGTQEAYNPVHRASCGRAPGSDGAAKRVPSARTARSSACTDGCSSSSLGGQRSQ